MGSRRPETIVKRAREQALREKRERKQAKKDARAVAKLEGELGEGEAGEDEAGDEQDGEDDAPAEGSEPQAE